MAKEVFFILGVLLGLALSGVYYTTKALNQNLAHYNQSTGTLEWTSLKK